MGLFGDSRERRRLERENARLASLNSQLIERLMYACDKPWTPAPADVVIPVEQEPEPDLYVEIDELPTL